MNNNSKIGIIDDWVYIYKQYIPNYLYNDLTFKLVRQDNGKDIEETIKMYDEIDNNIIAIPRYCSCSKSFLNNNKLIDTRTDGADIDIDISVKPRDHFQEDAVNAIISNDHGIICAKTAFGKTYVAINAISKLKKKALILMHKRDLMLQWREDFLRYTNLNEDDILIFENNNFDINKKIVITTVQNICAKIRNNNENMRQLFKNANFGITFYDECHTTVGPLANTQSSRFVFSKRIYGLSATPKRGDNLDLVINSILGNIIYTDERKMLPVYVSFASASVPVTFNMQTYFSFSKKLYTLRYNKWLAKSDTYTDYCANIIFELIKYNKKILAVAAIKDVLSNVYDKTYKLLNDNGMNNKIEIVHGTSESKFTDIKNMNDDEIDNFNCVFSTNKFFSEGLSINWLDTIVYLTSPSAKSLSSIPQLVGRIVREYKNKKYVMVIDIFNDKFNIELFRHNKRIEAYKLFKYNILSIPSQCNNNPKQIIDYTIETLNNKET